MDVEGAWRLSDMTAAAHNHLDERTIEVSSTFEALDYEQVQWITYVAVAHMQAKGSSTSSMVQTL